MLSAARHVPRATGRRCARPRGPPSPRPARHRWPSAPLRAAGGLPSQAGVAGPWCAWRHLPGPLPEERLSRSLLVNSRSADPGFTSKAPPPLPRNGSQSEVPAAPESVGSKPVLEPARGLRNAVTRGDRHHGPRRESGAGRPRRARAEPRCRLSRAPRPQAPRRRPVPESAGSAQSRNQARASPCAVSSDARTPVYCDVEKPVGQEEPVAW